MPVCILTVLTNACLLTVNIKFSMYTRCGDVSKDESVAIAIAACVLKEL